MRRVFGYNLFLGDFMNKSNVKREQSFLYATLVLGVSTVLVKVLGAIFRIPISNLIGASGMGYFSTAYDIFMPIYSLAMAGLPVAVARIIAEQVAQKKYKDARKTFKITKYAFWVTGIVGLALMFIMAYVVTAVASNPRALPAAIVIAPSILFCCIMSAYRGYYEGLRNMYPTAISSLIEAVCKLVLGYGFAFIIMKNMQGEPLQVASYAAAGAMLGITLGSVFGAIYLALEHKIKGDGFSVLEVENSPEPETGKKLLKTLIVFAIPVAIGSLVNNVASLIDVAMVQRQIKNAVETAPEFFNSAFGKYLFDDNGVAIAASNVPGFLSNFLYGCYKGYAYTIFNLVPSITCVVGVSALPILTAAWTKGEKTAIKANIESMLKTITLIAFPAGIGILALAPQIVSLLYSDESAVVAVNLLRVLGVAACFAGMTTPLTNMLQAIGKPSVPVKNIAVGAVIKIVVNFVLVGIPEINILGAPIGTLCCYLYIAIADIYCLVKYSKIRPNFFAAILKPFLAALCCGLSAFGVNALLSAVISHQKLVTLTSVLVAALVYVVAVAVLKCISAEDVETLPKGEKLVKVLGKFHII
jgi:stage V sporulation protein B